MPHSRTNRAPMALLTILGLLAVSAGTALAFHGSLDQLDNDDMSVRTVTRIDNGDVDQLTEALDAPIDVETLVNEEIERMERRDALEDEGEDVVERCIEQRDGLRAEARAAGTADARVDAEARLRTLVSTCRSEISSIRADLDELEEEQRVVRLDHPRYERLLDVTRERLEAEDRREDIQEACDDRRTALQARHGGDAIVARLDAQCENALEEQDVRVEMLTDQERVLASGPSGTILFQALVRQQREQFAAQEDLDAIEDDAERLEARCALRGDDDRCRTALARLDAQRAQAQARVDATSNGIDGILSRVGGDAGVEAPGAVVADVGGVGVEGVDAML